MKTLITVIFSSITIFCNAQQSEKRLKFSANEVNQDLTYLYTNLEASHFNLFVNNPKKVFDKEYKRMQNEIKDSMSFLEVSYLFQSFAALSRLGHCNTSFPFSNSYVPFVMGGGKVFPFDVSIRNKHSIITANYTTDKSIENGCEILAIDGIPMVEKLKPIYRHLSGENESFKNTQIDIMYFPRVWWLIYGSKDLYTIKIKERTGKMVEKQFKAIRALEYETKAASKPSIFNTGRSFKFIENVAYLHPGQFLNNETNGSILDHQGLEKGEFLRYIDSSFNQINKRNPPYLIIDLRGNPGGDNSFSDEMVAYFANKSFWFCSKFLIKTSSHTKKFWKDVNDPLLADLKEKILTYKDGEIFEAPANQHAPKPDSVQYKGKVFVLINRYSFSNAVTTAAMIQDYGFGKLIGETTVDPPTTYAAVHEFYLPHTGIAVTYPKAFMIRPNGNQSLEGLKPDYVVPDGMDILEYALKLTKK